MLLAGIVLYVAMAIPMFVLNRSLSARIAEHVQRWHATAQLNHRRLIPAFPLVAIRMLSEFRQRNDARRVRVMEELRRACRPAMKPTYRQRMQALWQGSRTAPA